MSSPNKFMFRPIIEAKKKCKDERFDRNFFEKDENLMKKSTIP